MSTKKTTKKTTKPATTTKKPRVTIEMPPEALSEAGPVAATTTEPARETTAKSTGNSSLDRRLARNAKHQTDKAPTATAEPETELTEKLTNLTVPQLQARYLEVVGRTTSSSDKPYLLWKIREARKGRIPIGPRKNAQREDVAFKVLPLRMESEVVEKLDEAWRRHGLATRTALLRKALHDFLVGIDEHKVAEMLFSNPRGEE